MSIQARAWTTTVSDDEVARMINAAHQARSEYLGEAIRGLIRKLRAPRPEPKVARPGTTWAGLPRLIMNFTSNGAPDGLFSGR